MLNWFIDDEMRSLNEVFEKLTDELARKQEEITKIQAEEQHPDPELPTLAAAEEAVKQDIKKLLEEKLDLELKTKEVLEELEAADGVLNTRLEAVDKVKEYLQQEHEALHQRLQASLALEPDAYKNDCLRILETELENLSRPELVEKQDLAARLVLQSGPEPTQPWNFLWPFADPEGTVNTFELTKITSLFITLHV